MRSCLVWSFRMITSNQDARRGKEIQFEKCYQRGRAENIEKIDKEPMRTENDQRWYHNIDMLNLYNQLPSKSVVNCRISRIKR